MSYVRYSACKGTRPRKLNGIRRHSRPHLVSKLLQERQVARFVIAPDGFGKSSVADEYADMVFHYAHTFWLDAQSPCFLRDLDSGSLVEDIFRDDAEAGLVVFDDVPCLDAERAGDFSRIIDSILERNCEVLVTMQPTSDSYGPKQLDRVVLNGLDLLIQSEEEYDHAILPARTYPDAPLEFQETLRHIPALAWDGESGAAQVIAGMARETLPAEVLLPLFVMMVLGKGTTAMVDRIAPRGVWLASSAASRYPFLWIDEESGMFWSAKFEVEALLKGFSGRMESLLSAYYVMLRNAGRQDIAMPSWIGEKGGHRGGYRSEVDNLMGEIANASLESDAETACLIMLQVRASAKRQRWLWEHRIPLLLGRCCIAARKLFGSLKEARDSEYLDLIACKALGSSLQNHRDGVQECAQKVFGSSRSTDEAMAFAGVALMIAGEVEPRMGKAAYYALSGILDKLHLGRASEEADDDHPWRIPTDEHALTYLPLVSVACVLGRPVAARRANGEGKADEGGAPDAFQEGYRLCLLWEDLGASPDALALGTAWVMRAQMLGRGQAAILRNAPARAASMIYEYLDNCCEAGDGLDGGGLPALYSYQVYLAYLGCGGNAVPVPRTVKGYFSRLEEEVRFSERVAQMERGQAKQAAASCDPKEEEASCAVEHLRIELFGGLTLRYDGKVREHSGASRQKVRTLLALLAMNTGREISRDRLARQLWPELPIERARKNFYAICSQLKQMLTDDFGRCPHFVRLDCAYKFDGRYVSCDVQRFEAICSSLMGKRSDMASWSDMLAELKDSFAGELLPSDTRNAAVNSARRAYHEMAIDSLMCASRRLLGEGEPELSLQFAREAMRRDQEREDVYIAQMRAYEALGQRAAVRQTYLDLHDFIVGRLNLDVSPEAVEIFRRVSGEEFEL